MTKQITTDIQTAFDLLNGKIKALEEVSTAHISVHKMIIRAFLDLGHVELEKLIEGLKQLKGDHIESEVSTAMFNGIIASFEDSHGKAISEPPHLSLVPATTEED